MSSFAFLEELPEGYVVERSACAVLAVRASLAQGLRECGFTADLDGALARSDLAGRRPLYELTPAGQRWVVRRFSHGGLLRWLTGARFFDPSRPFRELALAHALERRGLRTPQVVAARARRAAFVGWRLDLVTQRVEGALDLAQALAALGQDPTRKRLVHALLASAGTFVRTMQTAGLRHADLTPRNLLVERAALRGDPPRWWILDLDRSELRSSLGDLERRTGLRRLYRHVARLSRERTLALERTDLFAFLYGYEPDRRTRKELWRAIEREHAHSSAFHAFAWRLEAWLAGRRGLPAAPAEFQGTEHAAVGRTGNRSRPR